MLVNLIENILPLDFFANASGLLIEKKIFSNLVEFYLPEIYAKAEELNFDVGLLSIQ